MFDLCMFLFHFSYQLSSAVHFTKFRNCIRKAYRSILLPAPLTGGVASAKGFIVPLFSTKPNFTVFESNSCMSITFLDG